jgi:hypothetical protein
MVIVKERDTPLEVNASSDLATESIKFNIGPGIVDTPTPTVTSTSTPTDTPTASPTPTDTPTVENTPTLTPTPEPTPLPPTSPPPPPVSFADLIYALVGMLLIGGIAFTLGGDRFSLEERVRPALFAVAIGLVGYIGYTIYARTYPESSLVMRGAAGHWVAPLVSLVFAIGAVVAWFLKPGRIFWEKDVERWQVYLRKRLGTYVTDGRWLAWLKAVALRDARRQGQNNRQD